MICQGCGHHQFQQTIPGMNYPDDWSHNVGELSGRHRLIICKGCGAIVDSETGKIVDRRVRPAIAYVALAAAEIAGNRGEIAGNRGTATYF